MVALMKALPETDPRSYGYQAALYGTISTAARPGWGTSQHGNWFFLSWNRMHLYYFERIGRAVLADPSFTVPYWDFSNGNSLPPEFWQDENSPLYVAQRSADANAGMGVPPVDASLAAALSATSFTDSPDRHPTGFGGAEGPPNHEGKGAGELESSCGPVNTWVGGARGYLSDPNYAALDPIFWLHRANIDRLWEAWAQRVGNENPHHDSWRNQAFDFFDSTGKPVRMTPSEAISTSSLGYVYDHLTVLTTSL